MKTDPVKMLLLLVKKIEHKTKEMIYSKEIRFILLQYTNNK